MKDMTMYEIGYEKAYDSEPEWMRNERYEYCEGFLDKFEKTPLTDLANFIQSLFTHTKVAA